MLVIKSASIQDIDSIVKIHSCAFKDYFLTSLGIDFLRTYYSSFLKDALSFVKIAEEDGQIIGFSAATEVSKGFNKHLYFNNLIRFFGVSMKLLVSSPYSLIRLAKNFSKKNSNTQDRQDYAELFSIGVLSNQQGKGVGTRLILETESELKKRGVTKISLTTDYYNNEKAISFYQSMGYETLYVFIAFPNRKMYRLIKCI